MEFEDLLLIKELFLLCPFCNNKIYIRWKELELYKEKKCNICNQGMLLTNEDYTALKNLEQEIKNANIIDSCYFYAYVSHLFNTKILGNLKTNGKGGIQIQIDETKIIK